MNEIDTLPAGASWDTKADTGRVITFIGDGKSEFIPARLEVAHVVSIENAELYAFTPYGVYLKAAPKYMERVTVHYVPGRFPGKDEDKIIISRKLTGED